MSERRLRQATPREPGRRVPRPTVLLGALLAVLAMAPTPGDIGGCGQSPEDLDPGLFFGAMRGIDCESCQRCGVDTATCQDACGTEPPALIPLFPQDCAPLAHDGEVCLRRLRVESCDNVAVSLADDAQGKVVPITARPRPTECQFCPPRAQP